MNSEYKIEDNYLEEEDFARLKDLISPEANLNIRHRWSNVWNYVQETVDKNIVESFPHIKSPSLFSGVTEIEVAEPIFAGIFSHIFLWAEERSQYLPLLEPLLARIDPIVFYRIQANLTQGQRKKMRSDFHIDCPLPLKKTTPLITSIFYMNTTNGPTILEDGTEIECRANRLVSFPFGTYHSGVLCTNQPYRFVINFNYFKEMELC